MHLLQNYKIGRILFNRPLIPFLPLNPLKGTYTLRDDPSLIHPLEWRKFAKRSKSPLGDLGASLIFQTSHRESIVP